MEEDLAVFLVGSCGLSRDEREDAAQTLQIIARQNLSLCRE